MVKDDLSTGIEAAQAGNYSVAQVALSRYVLAHPGSQEGWLWLGKSMSTPSKQEFCYQKVLELDPNNMAARRALLALQSFPAAAQGQQDPLPTPPVLPEIKESKFDIRPVVAGLGILFILLAAFVTVTGRWRAVLAPILPPAVATPAPLPTVTAVSIAAASKPTAGASLAPTVTLTPATTPTLARVRNTTLEIQADGTTRLVDYDGNYALLMPTDWMVIRPATPEFYRIYEKEGHQNEFLRRVMDDWQSSDLDVFRFDAFYSPKQAGPDDLGGMDVQYFVTAESVDQVMAEDVAHMKNRGFKISRSSLTNTHGGKRVGVVESQATGMSSIVQDKTTYYYKHYLIRAQHGIIVLGMTTIGERKDQLFSQLDQVLETVELLQ